MKRTITELGQRELEFLATLSQKGARLFSSQEAVEFWGSPEYAHSVLHRLESKGWLERLEQGRYMIIPLEAGPERQWSEDALSIGTFLAQGGAAAYRTAVRYWNWTTQVSGNATFVVTKRRFNWHPSVLGVNYDFILLKPSRLFGVTETWRGQFKIRVTDRERTVLDILDRTDLSDGIPEVAEALKAAWPTLDFKKLTEYLERFGSGTVPKRLGFLAERLGLEPAGSPNVERWRSLVKAGITSLERGGPSRGPIVRSWRLRINVAGFESGQPR